MSKVSEVMTRGVRTLPPTASLVQAAQAMDALDVGSLPVCDGQSLLGKASDLEAGRALGDISEPSKPDRSGQSAASSQAGGGSTSSAP